MLVRDVILLRAIGFVGLLFLGSCGQSIQQVNTFEEFKTLFEKPITSERDIYGFFPKSVEQVHEYASFAIKKAQQSLDALINIESKDRTFENTASVLDKATSDVMVMYCVFSSLFGNH